MKVFISVDMEGVAGISAHEQTVFGAPDYDRCRALMTGEANAAVIGAFEGGAEEVVVCDAHSRMINLLPEKLDSRARLISGYLRGGAKAGASMLAGLDGSFEALMCIGYHAKDGTGQGLLNHTMNPKAVKRVKVNGLEMGEIGLNAAWAGAEGVPVCFVSGDRAAVEEARELMPWLESAAVKQGLGRYTAEHLHPDKARELISAGVRTALGRLAEMEPLKTTSPVTVELALGDTTMADLVELIPGAERTGGKGISYRAPDFTTANNFFRAALIIAGAAWNKEY